MCCFNISEFHLVVIFSGRRRREEKEWEVSEEGRKEGRKEGKEGRKEMLIY